MRGETRMRERGEARMRGMVMRGEVRMKGMVMRGEVKMRGKVTRGEPRMRGKVHERGAEDVGEVRSREHSEHNFSYSALYSCMLKFKQCSRKSTPSHCLVHC